VIHALRVLRAAAMLELRYLAVNRFMLFCVFVQPFFVAVTTMFMLRRGALFDPTYVVVGATLTGMWSLMLFNGNWTIGGERWQGTLELTVGAPTPVILVIAGKLIGTTLLSFVSMVVCCAVGAWLFGYSISIAEPVAFVPSVVLTLVGLWATAMLIAPLGILWRWVGQILNVFEYPVYMLAGFLFPIVMLPTWSNPASWILPPFWGATAMRISSSGVTDTGTLVVVWTILLLSSLAAILLARPFFALILRRATADGTLALA